MQRLERTFEKNGCPTLLPPSLKLESFAELFFSLGIAREHIHYTVGSRRRGGNISVDLSLFVLLYNTNVIKNFNLMFFQELKMKNNSLTIHIFFSLQNRDPAVHAEERLVNLERGRECFVDHVPTCRSSTLGSLPRCTGRSTARYPSSSHIASKTNDKK